MSEQTPPYEAYYPTPRHAAQSTWTPPPPAQGPDIYDQIVKTVRSMQAMDKPTPEPTEDEVYAAFFAPTTEETR